jgi:ribosomal protein L7/L12
MAIVEITGWQVGFNKVACTKIVRAASGLNLADGKRVTDGVLARKVQRISVPSDEVAQGLVRDLTEIGAVAMVIEDPRHN